MKDIAVYTTSDVLAHKKRDGWVFWHFNRLPKNIESLVKDGRIYFAAKKMIVGYFSIDHYDGTEIEWHSDSWRTLKNPMPVKPFQGFKYIERGSIT